ncbi:hypothetical protein JKP88DRAFT_156703 [Tribonema minus]|uniref:Uncharacterized protein n=1 Tax=Tribonema minus TaxID=303371 RepID=A0A836CPS8_9STRA|nr:hypothetical protein JKP88DRAFT_156703 [Tribonema minus]
MVQELHASLKLNALNFLPYSTHNLHNGKNVYPFPRTFQFAYWIKALTTAWFESFMGKGVMPEQVFVSGTVDQAGNVKKALAICNVPVLECAAHRLNTCVQWAVGLAGTTDNAVTIKNPAMRTLIGKVGSIVSHFNFSTVANDAFKDTQDLITNEMFSDEGCPPDAVNLIDRNDTR